MKTPMTALTDAYVGWLEAFRLKVRSEAPKKGLPPKVAAEQEWEDEGGAIKPEKIPAATEHPKIPF